MGIGDFLKHVITAPLDAFNNAIGLPTPDHQGGTNPGILDKPLETFSAGMRWTYSNVISQPLSTVELMGRETSVGGGDWTRAFSAGEWAKVWHAANHISPGQAIFYGKTPTTSLAAGAQAGEKLINSPLEYAAPDLAQLPPEWHSLPRAEQQKMLAEAGMPQVNKAVADANRDSQWFHYASGAADFAINWELDPMVLGGKALGAVKTAKMVRPTTNFTPEDIRRVMNSDLLSKTQRWLWANRSDPQLVNNLTMVRKSAMGPKFGAILSTLKSEQEVNLFLRTTMGDTVAKNFLEGTNKAAAMRMESANSRLSLLGQQLSAAASPGERQLIQAQIDAAHAGINADVAMVNRYNQIIDSMHELDALNLTKWSFARAEDRTAAQNAYRAGPATNLSPIAKRAQRAPELDTSAVGPANRLGGGPLGMQLAPFRLYSPAFGLISQPILPRVAMSRIYTDFWGIPVTVARSFSNFRPSGHIDVNALSQDSINELRGYLARIPHISDQARGGMLNDYLKAETEMDRKNLLLSFEKLAVAKVAAKHGFTPEDGLDIFRKHRAEQANLVERMNQYSTAVASTEGGRPIYADYFHDQSGAFAVHPNLATRLVNDHIMMDLDRMDTLLARHGSALKAIRPGVGNIVDGMAALGDTFNSMWKFGTLFRLGYIPRVLGDDLAGQVARLGAAAMALRVGVGVKNLATNAALWMEQPFLEQRAAVREAGAAYAKGELKGIEQQSKILENFLKTEHTQRVIQLDRAQRLHDAAVARRAALPPTATPAKVAAHDAFVQKRAGALKAAQARVATPASPGKVTRLADLRQRGGYIQRYIDLATKESTEARAKLAAGKTIQGKSPLVVNGVALPGALTGVRGEFYQKLISPDQSLENIFGANQGFLHGLIQRSFSHGAIQARAVANPETHMQGWLHILNHQFAQDALGRQALNGATVDDMTRWLTRDPAGRAYFKRLGVTNDPPAYLAHSVKADIDEIAPTPAIRAAALTPEGVTKDLLDQEIPNLAHRPDVHVGQTYVGRRETEATSAKIFRFWFDTVAGLPAARWSRHPLFNQLYEGHARAIMAKEKSFGVVHTADDAERIAETARRLALKDTKKLVFDVTHRSDAVGALKLISPFFAATSEGWQRWARIIADKPQTVGYAAKFFNTPLALGKVQDQNGNPVDQYGFAYDPEKGKRYQVSKADRRIVTRLPKWAMDSGIGYFLGASPAGKINLSQDSMNLVLSGDPVWNPGTGPIVQIPIQELVKDKPGLADIAQAAGVLPFGVSTSSTYGSGTIGRLTDAVLPRSLKNFLTAYDTSDDRYQAVKLQITQQAMFEHDHLGKPMPSASEIAQRVKDYWLFSAATAFLGPIASKREDPYQWYRDQYYKLRSVNPKTADDQFLSRYGESYFLFAQAQSKNVAGLEANRHAVDMSRKYADLIASMPELGALIVGPNGTGSPFDQVSYAYQLNTPLVPGSAEMQRRRLSADEAIQENQRRLGWAKYTAAMHQVEAKLFAAGFQSFDDPGAEGFKAEKKAWTDLYSQPLYPDGTVNPYYNAAWSKDYSTYDATKYARLIPAMTKLVNSDLGKDPQRRDLHTLAEYLGGRQQVMSMLNERKNAGGSAVLTAQDNFDLLAQWQRFVQGLVESNTLFGDLYHRYLGRDLGVDAAPEQIAGGQ